MRHRALRRQLDHQGFTIRPMTEADLPQAHQLSVEVGWPHRPDDWRLIFGLGEGFVACDEIGRALGSAMWWPFGDRFATVGMVIISPRLQAQGAGRRLMDTIFERVGNRDLRLNSTAAGYRLYRSLDFEPIGRIFQHQGRAIVPIDEVAGRAHVRPLRESDHRRITELDRAAYGADRSRVIAALLARSSGVVYERAGEIVGFALARPFGRGTVIGPIVAEDDEMAIALVTPHVEEHAGTFLRVDTAFEEGAFGQYLENAGMPAFDTVETMVKGKHHRPKGPARIFGLVTQALG